ncbi:MAG: L-histidine Nalpha-methyltransferase [Candidatus Eremiobacteraeota bacterium]|nr:L-histidine Nalpha-methyltransferase [Candidatus Eremiobacteraeota bacterium]MEA2721679.1 L-histidine Nalpha-methyltransferase [Candidatus Eremiobacteraeota bacterium]
MKQPTAAPTPLPESSDRFVLYRDPHPVRVATFAEDVRESLGTRPLSLSPKYFYDDLGSALFEAITRLPEYYLTRVERDLLATYGREIAGALDGPVELVELGSGSAIKTRLLIDAILERQPSLTYHPIDISADAVTESSLALSAAYERLRIVAYAGDYFPLLRDQRLVTHSRVLVLFLGSNIGNFEPADARELLHLLAKARHPGDGLLIGYDLKKDPSILELAYNDPTGVTAAFNKNLLGRMNRELDADFDLDAFRFRANWDDEHGAVRSFLISERDQRVRIPTAGLDVDFAAGESIHTESSYKFSREDIVALARSCGFAEKKTYTDAGGRYALSLLTVV